ncbi:hypothetical protein E1176_01130, partial [Fulvivirga sp. RKSG066]|uniref:hypothetical protein n=1 Tax=Fulvivirga aurantia TaxID=2529383 RepID=UPI001CA3D34C
MKFTFVLIFIIGLSDLTLGQVKVVRSVHGGEFDVGKMSPEFLIDYDSSGFDMLYTEGKYGGGTSEII